MASKTRATSSSLPATSGRYSDGYLRQSLALASAIFDARLGITSRSQRVGSLETPTPASARACSTAGLTATSPSTISTLGRGTLGREKAERTWR